MQRHNLACSPPLRLMGTATGPCWHLPTQINKLSYAAAHIYPAVLTSSLSSSLGTATGSRWHLEQKMWAMSSSPSASNRWAGMGVSPSARGRKKAEHVWHNESR